MIAAWAWIKKYWEIAVGGFLLFLGVFVGWWFKKPVVIEAKSPEQKKLEDQTTAAETKVLEKAKEQQQELRVEQTKEVNEVVESEKANEPALEKDSDATNAFLKQVGRSVRGDDNGGQQ